MKTLSLSLVMLLVLSTVMVFEVRDVSASSSPNGGHPNSHGLTIYFPDEQGDYEGQYDYTEFTSCTQWDEFLKAYLGI